MSQKLIEIANNDRLLRRANFKNPSYVRSDMTVTSFAFKPRKGEAGLSVDIERLTTCEKSINDPLRYRLFAILAESVRKLNLECIHNPVGGNYAHAEIEGHFTNSISSKLAKAAVFVPYPFHS